MIPIQQMESIDKAAHLRCTSVIAKDKTSKYVDAHQQHTKEGATEG